MTDQTDRSRLETEAEFHDRWAEETRVDDVPIDAAFRGVTAPENRFILERMGDLRGKRVLDIGAGLGESSVFFAQQGAEVVTSDLSPKMVEFAVRLGRSHGVEIQGVVASAEDLRVPSNSFDFVYMGNLIHHIEDRDRLFASVRDALKPGGFMYSWDPIAYNPAINVYRRIATGVRTPDEAPLTRADVARMRRYFVDVGHREFWLLTLAIFGKYYFLDRLNPNQVRYWKRILQEHDRMPSWFGPLQSLDAALLRLPALRWLAWNIVMWGRKA